MRDGSEQPEPRTDPTLEWPPEDPGTTMGRLHIVAQVMTSGLWVKGETGRQLAEAWGLSISTIENYSSEASRWLKALTDPEEVKAQLAYYLSKNLRIADGNPRSVAEVSKAYAPLVGLGDKGPTVNVAIDARTGQLKPEVQAYIQASDEALFAAAREAALAAGADAGRYDEALRVALEGGGKMLVEAK